ncbi:MAG: Secreted protein [Actinoallomurus sp.]|nr:Secreted protein [Actinoallomurus sp.]
MSAFSTEWTRPDPAPPRRRGRRGLWVTLVVVLVLLGLVVAGDRLAAAYAENRIAGEIQKEGFGAKPDVTIDGFPFLTQVADRHFPSAHMTARNVQEGPLTISRIDGVARDVRVDSGFRKGTIGSVDGTATVGFGDLTKAAGQSGLELSTAGPDKVKVSVDLGVVSGTATAQVTKVGRDQIRVHTTSVEGFSLSDLGNDLDFTVPVTGLPMGMSFQSLRVSSKGVEMRVTGSHIAFSG